MTANQVIGIGLLIAGLNFVLLGVVATLNRIASALETMARRR